MMLPLSDSLTRADHAMAAITETRARNSASGA